jgi:hypothetical protein
MTRYFKPAESINAQIKNTEQQIRNHQHAVDRSATVLTEKIQQQMVKPGSLLLAMSIGFIVGELTQRRCAKAEDSEGVETSPLKTALSLIGSARTLYAALPLVLMITSRYQTDEFDRSMKANNAKRAKANP